MTEIQKEAKKMNYKKLLWSILALILIVLLLSGCSGTPIQSTVTPVPPTVTFTSIPPTHTVTQVPPTKAPSLFIRLGPGKYKEPIWLEVIEGGYKLISGTTLRPGSAIGVYEEWMTFPPGLTIDVEGGKITLKGTTYPQGTKLLVDSQGNLIQR